MKRTRYSPGARPGSAYVLALLLLGVFASLAVALAAESGMNLRLADNQALVQAARLEAEGGMAYLTYLLRDVSVPSGVSPQQLLDAVAAAVQSQMDGTPNLGEDAVSYDQTSIDIPFIATADDRGFSATLSLDGEQVRVAVVGRKGTCTRGVRMNFAASSSGSAEFDYGVATAGKLKIVGNARIRGANDPAEANVLVGTYTYNQAVRLIGNCEIGGDLFVSNPEATVSMTGNVSIGGESVWGGEIYDHIHIGVGPVQLPQPDPSVFEPFATNIVDGSTSTRGNRTFSNIRILAGTNPTFSGNITLKGVIFIETPNRVKFSGNVTITGVVVTQDAGDDATDSNYIHFTGNTTVRGVDQLPDEPEFAGLKQLPGTFLVAPGFSVKFTGNFGTISGAMAAEEFKFTGNAGGTVHGVVIVWGDNEFKLTGNSYLTIDLSGGTQLPPGLVLGGGALRPLPETYEEF